MANNNSWNDKIRFSTSQLLNFEKDSYLERTSRPFYAFVFLLPFIVFYEIGTILLNTDILRQSQVRVVTFVWLQNFLEYVDLGTKFAWAAPPMVVVVILLSLQIVSKKSWRVWPKDLGLMAIESILLAVPLIVLSLFLVISAENNANHQQAAGIVNHSGAFVCCAAESAADNGGQAPINPIVKSDILAQVVTGIGAGIYEELIFRLILICVFMVIFYDVLKLGHNQSVFLSVILSAALFSAHHHIDFLTGQQMEAFNMTEFLFRTIAGVYFAVLFAVRGFGITAGAHAFYDILAVFITSLLARG